MSARQVIFKFPLTLANMIQEVTMPRGAQLLRVDMHGGLMYVWARVDLEQPPSIRVFHIVGTGFEYAELEHLKYVGTVFDDAGFVWHVFCEKLEISRATDA
jgi:hypothetical protein